MANIDKAISWLTTNGRLLDVALVQFETSNKPQAVLEQLAGYSNSDGGFGHALEPDVRLAESSVLATTVALQVLSHCAQSSSNTLVQQALGYLQTTFDQAAQAWPIVPNNVNTAAHAPWWKPRAPEDCLINPRAEIVGYMYTWPEQCDLELRDKLTDQLMASLEAADSLEMHDLLVFDRLARSENFPSDRYKSVLQHFHKLAAAAIATNPAEWTEYGLTPLTVIDTPEHELASQFQRELKLNLEYLSDTQHPAGYWSPNWSWSGTFSDVWPLAEKDIKSLVTRQAINLFQRFEAFG